MREVIARHQLSARRSLGQHFLLDLNLTGRIARAAGPLANSTVIEIGPGPGGLTRALLDEGAARVVVVERDRRAAAAMRELTKFYPGRLDVIEGDALAIDAAEIAQAEPGPVKIVANLPYNIATRLLTGWLHRISSFESLTLMFQKEVAQRLTASPGSGAYGRLTVFVQWLCTAERLFDIPASAFVPPPKVTSSLVRLEPRPAPLAEAEIGALERTTQAAFGQRRKMLRSALKTLVPDPIALLETAGIVPTARAEELDIADFCALARALARLKA